MSADPTIAYHLGAPYTDEDSLIWSLRKDKGALAEKGIAVPRPKLYKTAMTEMLRRLDGAAASSAEQQDLMTSIIGEHQVKRLILSNIHFLGTPAWVLNKGTLYCNAGPNTARLRNLFPQSRCTFFLGISNPAVFIPQVFNGQSQKTYAQFVGTTDPESLRWSDVVRRIRAASPDVPLTVWCNEDTPIIWPSVLRSVVALPQNTGFGGELDIMERIVSPEGFARLKAYLEKHPGLNEKQRARVKRAFLEKFALPEAMEEEIDLPGWTVDMVARMTETYDRDVELIRQLDGVDFLLA